MFDWSTLTVGMLGLPFVAVATSVIMTKWIELKRYQIDLQETRGRGELVRQADVIDTLSRRVATLEAVATDPAQQLARSIDALPTPAYREH